MTCRAGTEVELADVTDPASMARVLTPGRFDAVVSCLASRTGAPKDAWAIDHDAQLVALQAAEAAGVGQFVLLSAICVQKPLWSSSVRNWPSRRGCRPPA
jgi:divinyl chlorophyllide a 8-vinyl-reductase